MAQLSFKNWLYNFAFASKNPKFYTFESFLESRVKFIAISSHKRKTGFFLLIFLDSIDFNLASDFVSSVSKDDKGDEIYVVSISFLFSKNFMLILAIVEFNLNAGVLMAREFLGLRFKNLKFLFLFEQVFTNNSIFKNNLSHLRFIHDWNCKN